MWMPSSARNISLTPLMRLPTRDFGCADIRLKALALLSAIPHVGDWLNTIPFQALDLHLQDWKFKLYLQYWLGLPMVEESAQCPICSLLLIPLATTKWAVVVMGITSTSMTHP